MKNTRLSPAGYVRIDLHDGGKPIEDDTRMCVHCGQHFTVTKGLWTPEKSRGIRRGFCMKCNGPLCGKQRCGERCIPVEKMVIHESFTAVTVNVPSLPMI